MPIMLHKVLCLYQDKIAKYWIMRSKWIKRCKDIYRLPRTRFKGMDSKAFGYLICIVTAAYKKIVLESQLNKFYTMILLNTCGTKSHFVNKLTHYVQVEIITHFVNFNTRTQIKGHQGTNQVDAPVTKEIKRERPY